MDATFDTMGMEEEQDDLHVLLERAAKLMVKVGYKRLGPVKIKVVGRRRALRQSHHEAQLGNVAHLRLTCTVRYFSPCAANSTNPASSNRIPTPVRCLSGNT